MNKVYEFSFVRIMKRLTLREKWQLLTEAAGKDKGIILVSLVPAFVGTFLLYLGIHFELLPLSVLGGFLIFFFLLVFVFIPSSVLYHYEKAMVAKYGKVTDAQVIAKEINDASGHKIIDSKEGSEQAELLYLLTYQFDFQNKTYTNTDSIDQTEFDKIRVGDEVPIKYLSTNPTQSSIRQKAVKRKLQ